MTTVATNSDTEQPARPFSCSIVSMTIAISDTRYTVDEIPAGECGTKAFRLTKRGGDRATYDVIRRHDDTVACDCPDYLYRHDGTVGLCKHGRALVELGLMPASCGTALKPAPSHAGAATGTDTITELATALGPVDALSEPANEPTADDLAEYATWRLEQDARDFLDHSATHGLAELVEHQSGFYDAWPTDAGKMIAEALGDLAAKIRYVGATTPAEWDARAETIEQEARQQWEDIGFEQGKAAALAECERKHGRTPTAGFGGHPAWED
jgi:hypothetical protein